MSTLGMFTVLGVAAVAGLVWWMLKRRSEERLDALLKQRNGSSKIAGMADYVEGMQHIPVVLALGESAVSYENFDLQAQLDIARIEEVEYDDELATGKDVPNGRVLRLRSHGRAFEFILPKVEADRWASQLPAHRMENPSRLHA
jgi:hypothetical protein